MQRARDRLTPLKAKAEAGEIHLLFADEAEVSTHPYLARVWAKRGADLRVPAPGKAVKRALFGARVHGRGQLLVQSSPTKDSAAFGRFLKQLKPTDDKRLHLVLDNGSIHTSRQSRKTLAACRGWLTVEWLPPYAPELNDIERDWRHLKCDYLAHHTFDNVDTLDLHTRASIAAINKQRAGCNRS